ncbi:allophanate hydrolase subunit 2-domain-containing protein [Mycena alexandri]|uniref:Allophanate hydrolase subunit 2-domain-containing protein n=1 Tax=Mycena alexandri TaxID=1745969 RepID=A0AAD6SUI8_9AGAR|nr:allophanate hydrolase subunit 2-domain-containing protein [Mycena alexandri]
MHKLLVANRGEIALRIIRTAKAEGIATVAIYTSSDALSPHVTLADEAVFLAPQSPTESESQAYLSASRIISVCLEHRVTMVHPGYGFLSENAEFAYGVRDAGIIFLGPTPDVIQTMGLKHLAREVAIKAGVACVPGSTGLVDTESVALETAERVGFPVMIKASAGGGGMGMVICEDEEALADAFGRVQKRAEALFNYGGVFLERYFPSARHIEIQIFGNGKGDVVCMGERECSIQRRHQKIIEETPSPFLVGRPDLRVKMCAAAIRLGQSVRYGSVGTFGSLSEWPMLLAAQVEHPITEAVHPGLDLVKLMIQQALAESTGAVGLASDSTEMQQKTYDSLLEEGQKLSCAYAFEARVYAENPAVQFRPCPGTLQYVNLPSGKYNWLRVETWISTGTTVTPFFDPLLAKIVVSGASRGNAISRLQGVLEESQIQGPVNNTEYLKAILMSEAFQRGDATTTFLSTFKHSPHAITVLSAAVDMTVQDRGRDTRLGIPRSGPMDSLSFRCANTLVDNPVGMEGLEMIILSGSVASFQFHVAAVVAMTGKEVAVKVDGHDAQMWSSVIVPAGAQLSLSAGTDNSAGLRTYLAVRGGFPAIPHYLGSKSTSVGLGGYQGRALIAGDELALAEVCGPTSADADSLRCVPAQVIPKYPSHFVIHVLAGPHDDEEYITREGISQFYATNWRVSPSCNRMGVRLENPGKISWARANGGAGGSHPSNILDNGYALGTINMNGDTPVILTNEGPDMGGYVCFCTVASADMWKLGQLSAGSTIEFRRVSWTDAMALRTQNLNWLEQIQEQNSNQTVELQLDFELTDHPQDPKLLLILRTRTSLLVVLRQAGDSAILVEYGELALDFSLRARVHAFETILKQRNIPGILAFCPCVRSTMCHFDPTVISQSDVVAHILDVQNAMPHSMDDMTFPGRRLIFPIVLDDRWSREALQRYMNSIRDKAVYLPSNVDYLARNNGLDTSKEALAKLISSDWLVFGVGFYLACPFLIPIDPRCRLVAQKMNPSRTYTPRAAIYPIVSPGGYMMYGRTLPAWDQWGKGPNFTPESPWLLQPFDQVRFEPVTESEYLQIESEFDAGRYMFKIEETTFSMAEYSAFITSIADEVAVFEAKQTQGVEQEEIKERQLLQEWESEKISKAQVTAQDEGEGSAQITSPLFGNVWKIFCHPGDIIASGDTTVAILETMKTEIPIKAGDANVGKTVSGVGKGISEGGSVNAGDTLIVLV